MGGAHIQQGKIDCLLIVDFVVRSVADPRLRRFYAALYSAAFFTTDVQKLYAIGFAHATRSTKLLRALQEMKEDALI